MKEKTITVRISDVLWDEIQEVSKEKDLSQSKITRAALEKYLLRMGNPFPLISWGRNEFSFALSCLSDLELDKLAEISVQNGIKTRDYFVNNFLKTDNLEDFQITIRTIIYILENYALNPEGQNWCKTIKSIWKGNWVLIIGTHENGLHFSKYVKFIYLKYFNLYSYDLIKEDLQQDKLTLEFEKRDL